MRVWTLRSQEGMNLGGYSSTTMPSMQPCRPHDQGGTIWSQPDPWVTMHSSPCNNPHWAGKVSMKQNSIVLSHWECRRNLFQQQGPAWLGYYSKPCAPCSAIQALFVGPWLKCSVFIWAQFFIKSHYRLLLLNVSGISPRALLHLDMMVGEVSCFPGVGSLSFYW